ncbi:MAG: long-chain-acyl-CoA synthetase [Desulfobacteraceae bacterium]|nr:MAG: long-chain-acyl-CoA synthetase [Desulfobacteraceae bacterium]
MAALNHKDLVTFGSLVPGIVSKLVRLPSVVNAIKSALHVKDDDYLSLGWKIEENARLYPDRPAILCENERLTHREYNEAVNRYCHYLLSEGVKKGEPVVVMLENRPEFLMVAGALAKIGAIASLINTNQRNQVLLHSISLTKGLRFIIGEELVDAFETVRPDLKLSGEETFYFVPDGGKNPAPKGYIDLPLAAARMPADNPKTTGTIQAKDPICYIFTSGTTGMPKAAIMGNRRWVSAMFGLGRLLMNMKTDDVLYCPLPLFHTTGFCVGWTVASSMGSAFAIRRKFSAGEFWKDAEKFNATAFVYIGELCRYLLNQPESLSDGRNPMKKCIGNGLRPDIWSEFKSRFAIRQISELYGATEFGFAFVNLFNIDNTVGMCLTPFAIVRYDIENEKPILDANGYMPRVKKGESGILLGEISDKTPFHGYTDPKASEQKIWRDVFKQGDIWLNTGDFVRDLGYRHIQFSDRLGDTFRWKGENVSTTEVEETINTMEHVEQAAVYGVRIPGTDGRAGMAAIIPSVPEDSFDLKELAETLHRVLPPYAIPKFIRFKKEIETTPTFKVKKVVLHNEGFDPGVIPEPLFAMLPGKKEYIPLNKSLYQDIVAGKYRF